MRFNYSKQPSRNKVDSISIRAKVAELRHIVVSGGPFCSFSSFEFLFIKEN